MSAGKMDKGWSNLNLQRMGCRERAPMTLLSDTKLTPLP